MSTTRERDPPAAVEDELAASTEVEQEAVVRPEIWVGPADDYEGDQRFGRWVDAAAEPEELQARISTIIDDTPEAGRQRWGIYDLRGFGGWEPDNTQGLPAVAMVARGIVEHGHAYSALVQLVGADSIAARPDRFGRSFVGEWVSAEDFAATFIDESGWRERLERLPAPMRPYVQIDVQHLLTDAQAELRFVEHEAGVWVFDPRLW